MSQGDAPQVILVGTSLTMCILSAALSRVQVSVLHVDPNAFYGGDESTLSLQELHEFLQEASAQSQRFGFHYSTSDGSQRRPPPPLERPRQYMADLSAPRLLLCRGAAVDLLVRSGVARYLEFKSLHNMLTPDARTPLPCSKSEVFTNRSLAPAEKRQLMKVLQYCLDTQADDVRWMNESNLLQGRALPRPQNKKVQASPPLHSFTQHLQDTVNFSVAFWGTRQAAATAAPDATFGKIQAFLRGLGRFGRTAFIAPVYGISELPQSFARLSAVYGGIFMLNERVEAVDPASLSVRFASGEERHARQAVVVGAECAHGVQGLPPVDRVATEVRLLCLSSVPLLGSRGEGGGAASSDSPEETLLMVDPPEDSATAAHGFAVHVLQTGSDLHTTPSGSGRFLVHFTSRVIDPGDVAGAHERLRGLMRRLVQAACPIEESWPDPVAWTASFQRELGAVADPALGTGGVHVVPNAGGVADPGSMPVDLDAYVHCARTIFERLCPGQPFLPPSQAEQEARADEDDVFAGVL